jgi:hypothetical protein
MKKAEWRTKKRGFLNREIRKIREKRQGRKVAKTRFLNHGILGIHGRNEWNGWETRRHGVEDKVETGIFKTGKHPEDANEKRGLLKAGAAKGGGAGGRGKESCANNKDCRPAEPPR